MLSPVKESLSSSKLCSCTILANQNDCTALVRMLEMWFHYPSTLSVLVLLHRISSLPVHQLATRRFYVLQLRTATVHGSLGYSGENVSWKVAASSSLPLVEVNGTTLYSVPRKAAKGEDTHTQMRARRGLASCSDTAHHAPSPPFRKTSAPERQAHLPAWLPCSVQLAQHQQLQHC